ncbi:ATP phosphoribosyltransferase regulatory subunit [Caryophanon latum]|uniref:ATP phosphoribosyltransferase regulatory subunit n=1 Tax=Caryophanon latum TaxID=33977 RepID=A0A1C0YWY9_9BACL|nr:ATP phosphoribosyltransferase regulatory subunit [Caryophanon latum]OCS91671.1 ATP phosphoribosyltransferase regulatory subunit [Caryophanon latum]
MSMIQMFEKPLGMRDTFPAIYEKLENVRKTGRNYLRAHGYEFIKTPTVEYYDTIGKASAIYDASLFKLVDSQGNTLVLRPDMTTPIARVATSKLLKEKIPLRLAYFANVFRAQETEGGRPAEFDQMGIELIGDASVYADAEVILTAAGLMKEFSVPSFKLTIGHAGILQSILNSYTDTDAQAEELRILLVQKNFVGFEEAVLAFELPTMKTQSLLQFIEEASNFLSLSQIEKYVTKNDALLYMKELEVLLTEAGLTDEIAFDFTLASHMNYYTGMLFEVFAAGSGFPIGNGGRYDGLLHSFGQTVGATGFGLRVDRLLEVLPKEFEQESATLVLFEQGAYTKALTKANALRAQGQRVTLQAKASLTNEAAFTAGFSEVVVVGQED